MGEPPCSPRPGPAYRPAPGAAEALPGSAFPPARLHVRCQEFVRGRDTRVHATHHYRGWIFTRVPPSGAVLGQHGAIPVTVRGNSLVSRPHGVCAPHGQLVSVGCQQRRASRNSPRRGDRTRGSATSSHHFFWGKTPPALPESCISPLPPPPSVLQVMPAVIVQRASLPPPPPRRQISKANGNHTITEVATRH